MMLTDDRTDKCLCFCFRGLAADLPRISAYLACAKGFHIHYLVSGLLFPATNFGIGNAINSAQ